MTFAIKAYEHVGIRVTDRDAARDFYNRLGWRVTSEMPEHSAAELVNESGVYINLIFNGVKRKDRTNILLDEPLRYPGMTHVAFVVDDLNDFMAMLDREGIRITEGPMIYSDRRRVIFIRDPDGNVLEFNELLNSGHGLSP
jgi:lactoylglutathione lyase